MSANGTFTSTLDYDFFGGGFVIVRGGASGSIDPTISSTSKVYIVGESSNNTISFSFDSTAQMPPASGVLEQELTFTFSATAEFGVQRWATANNRIEFAFEPMIGNILTHGSLDETIPFNIVSTAYQFSLGDSTVSYQFEFSGKGINISTHTYDKIGTNGIAFADNLNGVSIVSHLNMVDIREDGSTEVKILSPV